MLRVNTERLYILPLDQKNLELCIDDYDGMEKNLNLTVSYKKLEDRQKNVWRIRLNGVKSNPINYMWYTVWIIVLKEANRIIGTAMLKGYPNKNGEVIIGYVMEDDYRCKGYMTEALSNITQWIFLNSDVKCVLADTLKNNKPSHKVLQKIGMVNYKEDDECFWWKLEI